MAKPKHPTLRSLRQGQTVYCVVNGSLMSDDNTPDYVVKYHLHPDKTPLPPIGSIITELPVKNLKKAILLRGRIVMRDFYYSRRVAERVARR